MLNLIASRFADFTPALVTTTQNSVFKANVQQLENCEEAAELAFESAVEASSASTENFWLDPENYMARYRPYTVKSGVLMIPVAGVLLHNFPWATPWATGYKYIWEAFKRGQEDAGVSKIALLIHSGGGEVAGCFEAVDRMFAFRGKKPVKAFAHEYAYSAAYAIASVADEIVMSKTGGVGSIGVVTSHSNYAKMMDDIGIETTFITFGIHKVDGNPYEALSKDAKERIQARINELGEVFVATVARNRRMDAKAVRDTEALCYSPTEALKIGLADDVGPLDDALAAFTAADLSTDEGDEQMSNPATANQADIDNAKASGFEAGKAEGIKAGATAEKARISGILACEPAKDRPVSALALAMESEMTVEQATSFLGKLPVEKAEEKVEDKKTEAKGGENDADADNGNKQKFNAAMEENKTDVGGNKPQGEGQADADNADGVLDLAASVGIPGLRPRKKA